MMEIPLGLKTVRARTERQITFIKYSFNSNFFENLQLNRGFNGIWRGISLSLFFFLY